MSSHYDQRYSMLTGDPGFCEHDDDEEAYGEACFQNPIALQTQNTSDEEVFDYNGIFCAAAGWRPVPLDPAASEQDHPVLCQQLGYSYPHQNPDEGQAMTKRQRVGTEAAVATVGAKYRRMKRRSCYRHIPHREKPPQVVAKRNARERRRVHAVNMAFVKLRKAIPFDNKKGTRISKVRVLQRAIDYIQGLTRLIRESDGGIGGAVHGFCSEEDDSLLFDF